MGDLDDAGMTLMDLIIDLVVFEFPYWSFKIFIVQKSWREYFRRKPLCLSVDVMIWWLMYEYVYPDSESEDGGGFIAQMFGQFICHWSGTAVNLSLAFIIFDRCFSGGSIKSYFVTFVYILISPVLLWVALFSPAAAVAGAEIVRKLGELEEVAVVGIGFPVVKCTLIFIFTKLASFSNEVVIDDGAPTDNPDQLLNHDDAISVDSIHSESQRESDDNDDASNHLDVLGFVVVSVELLFAIPAKTMMYAMSSLAAFSTAQLLSCLFEIGLRVGAAIGSNAVSNNLSTSRSRGSQQGNGHGLVSVVPSTRQSGRNGVISRLTEASINFQVNQVVAVSRSLGNQQRSTVAPVGSNQDPLEQLRNNHFLTLQLSEVFANQEYAEFVSHFIAPIILISFHFFNQNDVNANVNDINDKGKDKDDGKSLLIELPIRMLIGLSFEIIADTLSSGAEERHGFKVFDVNILRRGGRKLTIGKCLAVLMSSLMGFIVYYHGMRLRETV